MRRYDDPVEVRRGMVGQGDRQVEAPEQFLWRGTLWKVREVVAHWVETGPWWQSAGARAVVGTDVAVEDRQRLSVLSGDLLAEREMWRVEAGNGMTVNCSSGVFDLAFSWADGNWQLLGCTD
ncbi:hypothetical protein BJ980_000913 [Nocardioides daedukensis]|uniref:DUF6504 domain-containing protein n=1 Tax=Nocardioides daedukensis TaxID=634462 RepID=A0A7Y9UVM6_9ACTN|nr:DUF6504 family protein [Nocardioides daedukensis]NYG57990.1 hypothetical protein [Nocardioides daedukensis]